MRLPCSIGFLIVTLAISVGAADDSRSVTVTFQNGDETRTRGPFSIPIDEALAKQLGESGESIRLQRLESADKGTAVPAQLIPGDSPALLCLLDEPLAADEKRAFEFHYEAASPSNATEPRMRCTESDEVIEIFSGDRLILGYRKTPSSLAATNEPVYSRTGYIHPLQTPGGRVITGDYPADHPHQHALFMAWTKTSFEGRPVNFWDQQRGKGIVSYRDTRQILSGPVFAQFTVSHRHEDATDPENRRPVLEEDWEVRAVDIGNRSFLIDILVTQRCASTSPLEIQTYHYGGMAIRGTDQWFNPDKEATPPGNFLTSEGLGRIEGNHSRPRWVSMHGPIDGEEAGVTIFTHPANFRFPEWVRLHPTKPYFVFTPQVEAGFTIEPDRVHVARYRYLVHDGAPDPDRIEQAWRDYAEPPLTVITDF